MIVPVLLMAVTAIGALFAVSVRNVLHAIFGLAVSLLGVAGMFLVLGSPFVAAMEVLIYVGGISVAMIFAVMLSTVVLRRPDGARRQVLAAAVAFAFFIAVALVIVNTDLGSEAHTAPEAWSVAAIGEDLLTHYNVVFELLSVVLLTAIVGAIVISRRDQPGTGVSRAGAPAASSLPDPNREHSEGSTP